MIERLMTVSGLEFVREDDEEAFWEFEIVNPRGEETTGKASGFEQSKERRAGLAAFHDAEIRRNRVSRGYQERQRFQS